MKHYEFMSTDGYVRQNFWNLGSASHMNPYWLLARNIQDNIQQRVIALTSLTYKFSNSIRFLVRAGYDGSNNSSEQKVYNDTYNIAPFGRYALGKGENTEWNGDALRVLWKRFGK